MFSFIQTALMPLENNSLGMIMTHFFQKDFVVNCVKCLREVQVYTKTLVPLVKTLQCITSKFSDSIYSGMLWSKVILVNIENAIVCQEGVQAFVNHVFKQL